MQHHIDNMGLFEKKAFTLAEVLITLGIIGVIAALTIPNLIASYQKKETVTQLKKTYSLIQQAVQKAEVDYDFVENWDFSLSANEFNGKYIRPYFQVIKEYDANNFPPEIHYTGISGNNCDVYAAFRTTPKIILNNGTMLTINKTAAGEIGIINIVVDLNGLNKPNQYGRDVFAFSIQPHKGVVPYGIEYTHGNTTAGSYDREKLMGEDNPRNCNRNKDGVFCAAVIMMDGWEIKDDYPW